MPARMIIGADLVPTRNNYELFEAGDIGTLIGEELSEKLNEADFTVFNLEVPLTDEQHPIVKCGPNLIAPTSTINGLKTINPHFFGLANNHILDQDVEGLASTLKTLKEANIAYSGVGKNLDEASKPFIKEINGKRVGIYCCAEHEFSIATETTPGANPFDPLESLDHVKQLKHDVDYVIVLYHGGKEHYRYPSPYLQKVCRKLVDKGADLVVCQHSHCIGCEEKYNNGTIVYGQGNFLFDNCDSEFWQTGLLIVLNDDFDVSYYPIVKEANTVRAASEERGKEILRDFYKRSEMIKNPDFVREEYSRFASKMYMQQTSPFRKRESFLFRVINKLSGNRIRTRLAYSIPQDKLYVQINFVECEAHRELLIEGLKIRTKDVHDLLAEQGKEVISC